MAQHHEHFPLCLLMGNWKIALRWGGGGMWHMASVLGCLPLTAPIGLSLLLILTLCGPERVLVVSTEDQRRMTSPV